MDRVDSAFEGGLRVAAVVPGADGPVSGSVCVGRRDPVLRLLADGNDFADLATITAWDEADEA